MSRLLASAAALALLGCANRPEPAAAPCPEPPKSWAEDHARRLEAEQALGELQQRYDALTAEAPAGEQVACMLTCRVAVVNDRTRVVLGSMQRDQLQVELVPLPGKEAVTAEQVAALAKVPWIADLSLDAPDLPPAALAPLAQLTKLRRLRLTAAVDSLAFLAGATELESLVIAGPENAPPAPPLDLAPLANATKLSYLSIGGRGVLSLAPLAKLTALEALSLAADGAYSDLAPLAGLGKLADVTLAAPKVTDLSPLGGLPLRSLELHGVGARDLKGLASASGLGHLALQDDPALTDIGGLAALTELVSVDLKGCSALTDVKPLAGLTALQELVLTATGVKDIGPLLHAKQLQSLALSASPVTSLAPLAGLTQLYFLDISDTRVSDLGPLRSVPNLSSLEAAGTPVKDVQALVGLKQLSSVDFARSKLAPAKLDALRKASPSLNVTDE